MQPPTWAIFGAIVAFALPASAVFGLLAIWLFERVTRRPPREHLLDDF